MVTRITVIGVLFGLATATRAGGQSVSVTAAFDSAEQFEQCFRDTSIDAVTTPGQVMLAPTEMVTSHTGNRISKVSFNGTRIGRKTYELDAVEATQAALYFFAGSGTATLNGHALTVGSLGHGGWSTAAVDPSWLQAGSNELIFNSGFNLAMDLEAPGGADGEISHNGGGSWQDASGAYLAHLRLWRHPAQAWLTSPVIDLANPHKQDVICTDIDVTSVQVVPTAVTPDPTAIAYEARSGTTPRPDDTWSDWKDTNSIAPARYVQWRAQLQTDHGAQTPVLDRVEVRAEADVRHAVDGGGPFVRRFDNQRIVRSSYAYTYQPPSPNLQQLRQQYNLDDVVAAGATDMEKLVLLRNWVRRQWPGNDAGSGSRTWNALEILGAPDGQHGMCVHYAHAFSQCALALGYTARPIVLTHHFVADVWSDEDQKWVLMDVEAVNADALTAHGTCLYRDNNTGEPLCAVDLHRSGVDGANADVQQQVYMMEGGVHTLTERTGPANMSIFNYFAYVNRNNHIDQLEPWEEYHGFDHYHSDAYRWWADGAVPLRIEYSQHTNRAADLNPSLNQAELTLTATGAPDELTVLMQTFTPNFDMFEYRLNGGAWLELAGLGSDPHDQYATLNWLLDDGINTIEVRSRNLYGHRGAISAIEINAVPAPAATALFSAVALSCCSTRHAARTCSLPTGRSMLR